MSLGRIAIALALAFSAGVSGGCSFLKQRSDPVRYYVLTTEAPAAQPSAGKKTLGVNRVTIPEYLNRSEMVTRTTQNEVAVSQFELWAEPIRDSLTRTLTADLAGLVAIDRVVAAPWDSRHAPDLTLDVEVRRFEGVRGQAVELEAVWTLRETRGGTTVATHHSIFRRPGSGTTTQASVAALSETVADLAKEIAATLRDR